MLTLLRWSPLGHCQTYQFSHRACFANVFWSGPYVPRAVVLSYGKNPIQPQEALWTKVTLLYSRKHAMRASQTRITLMYQPLEVLWTKISCQFEFFLALCLSHCFIPLVARSEQDLPYSRGHVWSRTKFFVKYTPLDHHLPFVEAAIHRFLGHVHYSKNLYPSIETWKYEHSSLYLRQVKGPVRTLRGVKSSNIGLPGVLLRPFW